MHKVELNDECNWRDLKEYKHEIMPEPALTQTVKENDAGQIFMGFPDDESDEEWHAINDLVIGTIQSFPYLTQFAKLN